MRGQQNTLRPSYVEIKMYRTYRRNRRDFGDCDLRV